MGSAELKGFSSFLGFSIETSERSRLKKITCMEGDFQKPPLIFSADEIDVCKILLQLPVLVCGSESSRLNCFRLSWGFKRWRSNPLLNSIKDKVRGPSTQVSSSPGEFQEILKRKRDSGDMKHESGRMKPFNLGLKAWKQENHFSPLGIHNIPFDLLAQEFDLKEAN